MAERKQRLELTWIGKDERPRLEPRILLEDPELSYHAPKRVTDHDIFDNVLIQGDNLLALKALEQDFSGKVKCIYIDPPYNTGSAFEQYDDGLEHSIWLSLMRDRLEVLVRLLHEDGSIWINIDEVEGHYLKVLCDEVFGRRNFVANIVWQKRTSRENRAAIGSSHDDILVYALRGPQRWKEFRNRLPANDVGYANPDDDPRGPWRSIPFSAQGFRINQMYEIKTPAGGSVRPPKGRCWGATQPVFEQHLAEGRVYFPNNGTSRPRIKQFRGEEEGLAPMTWWPAEESGDNEEAKKESLTLFPEQPAFGTPKPERLLERILTVATNPGEWVLDSFLGSGTTAAVAHKMGRRWIGIEVGEHAVSYCVPRLRKVVSGADLGGISDSLSWMGGGGFRFLRLAPSLLTKDKWGNWVVSKAYRPEMLAQAMCKLEGFRYAPDPEVFWIHGKSTERDFIYVTTQDLSREQLRFISDQMGAERTLLICCSAFRARKDEFSNLTLKKIPQAVLGRCEWGRDDYSLNVASLPPVEVVEGGNGGSAEGGEVSGSTPKARRLSRRAAMQELPLFAGTANGHESAPGTTV